MAFIRYYNSQDERETPFGYGWSVSFSETVSTDDGCLVLRDATGNAVYFLNDDGDGVTYISEVDKKRVIVDEGSNYVLTEPNGTVLTFDSYGYLTQIV